MKARASDLSTEMMDLKKCQIDLLKIAIALFTAMSSILIAFYNASSPFTAIYEDGSVNYKMIAVFVGLSSIIPILFPYLSWIIIYKSRSLFRISSYLRLLEHYKVVPDPSPDIEVYDFNYEKLYREMRKDKWLLDRFTESSFRNYLNRWRPYSYWQRIYCEHEQCDLESPYKGGFYSRILRFITYMTTIYFVLALLFTISFIADIISSPKYSWHAVEVLPFYAFIIIAIAYYTYNIILTFRHNKELLNIPFSQDAQYRMWNRAYERIKAKKSKIVHLENREFHRKKCKPTPVYFTHKGKEYEGKVLNFSKNGLFIKNNSPLPRQELFDFRIEPSANRRLTGVGKVAWSNSTGMGICLA